jgi:HD-GYP domain-containing protein (c-di-GMP phosphodiesterase class II)
MKLDAYDSPDAEALLEVGKQRRHQRPGRQRELSTQFVAAAGFIVAAVLLATLAPWHRALHPASLVLVVLTFVVVERVKFPVAGGWTYPTMLVFVPALFVLPTPIVPLIAAVAILLGGLPGYVRGRTPIAHIPSDLADAWWTIGPTLVIVLAAADRFAWSHWPVYLLALLAQVAFDMTVTITRSWVGEGTSPRVQIPLLTWIYVADAILAPLGLLIAAVSVDRPGLMLLALSPLAMLKLFARERQERMDETLALSTAYRGTALLLGDVVEADHHYTGEHSRQVVDLSVAVADGLGLDSAQKRNLEFAALLHDVGKIHIPKEIINKAGPLTDEEWAVMHAHTIDGERMLKQVGGLLADVGTIVRASHERWDGTGYPDGLAGEEIPTEARIVSTCDAFSAMTTDRSYRTAMSNEQALAELRRCAGTQFDPAVVAEVEKSLGKSAPAPAKPKLQPWQVMGVPRVAA